MKMGNIVLSAVKLRLGQLLRSSKFFMTCKSDSVCLDKCGSCVRNASYLAWPAVQKRPAFVTSHVKLNLVFKRVYNCSFQASSWAFVNA